MSVNYNINRYRKKGVIAIIWSNKEKINNMYKKPDNEFDIYDDDGVEAYKVGQEPVYSSHRLAKSNLLIGAKYKATALERKITFLAMLKVQENNFKEKSDGLHVIMAAGELREEIGLKGGSFYESLENAAKNMTLTSYGIFNKDTRKFRFIRLIEQAAYKNGIFEIVFAHEFKDDLLATPPTSFTFIPKEFAMKFKRNYSEALYENLKSICDSFGPKNHKFEIYFNLSELKLVLGIVDSNLPSVRDVLLKGKGTREDYNKAVKIAEDSNEAMYKRWSDMDSRCLRPAVREINEITPMDICYSVTKSLPGYKVEGVNFTVWPDGKKDSKNKALKKNSLTDNEKFPYWTRCIDLFKEYNIEFTDAKSICDRADYDEEKILHAKEILETKTKENIVRLLLNCIESQDINH